MDGYMTVGQAAATLGITEWGVRRRISRGEMQAERFGPRALLIPASEVERWKRLGRQKPGPKPRKGARDE